MIVRVQRLRGCCRPLSRQLRAFSQFSEIPLAPPDKILGLNEAFNADKNPSKVSLGVGAYRDGAGKAFVLPSVRTAEARVSDKGYDHEYAGIGGVQSYVDASIAFAYGDDSAVIKEGRVAAVQTLSGTGACRLVGDFVARFHGRGTSIYLPTPTWGNHHNIFRDAGLEVKGYSYFNADTCAVDFTGLSNDIMNAPEGSVFLFHACAHNPTGCDPTPAQWDELSDLMKAKNHLTFFDCAYQGFASGDSEIDAYSIRKFVSEGHNILLSQSFAKNFGLYGERVGTLSAVCADGEETARVLSQFKALIRAMYSNPPIYGARLIQEILSDPALRQQWTGECKAMADRIIAMRHGLRGRLEQLGSQRDWQHITNQIGMFCFTGLTKDEVFKMRADYAIYCTEDGRISMAGLTDNNLDYVAEAIHSVTK